MFYLTSLLDNGKTLLCIWETQEEKEVVLKYFYYPVRQIREGVETVVKVVKGEHNSIATKEQLITDPLVYKMRMQAEKRGFEGCVAPTAKVDELTPFVLESSTDYDELLGLLSLETLRTSE